MILSHAPYILPAFVDGSFQPLGVGREPGMHLSHIVHEMMVAANEPVETPEGEQDWMRAQIGFLWEAAIEWAWKEYQGITRNVERGVKLLADRIHMTPDGVNREEGILEEYKLTWKSMRRWEEAAEDEFWYWMVQTKGYLRALGMNIVRFIVFWAGGSYQWKKGRGPQPTVTLIRWTKAELDENWDTVLRYRDYLEKREVA